MKILLIILCFMGISLSSVGKEEEMQITFLKTFEPNCTQNNIVWLGTTNGLYISNNQKQEPVKGIKETHIKSILYQNNKYWITSHNGLYYIEPTNLTLAKPIEGLEDKIIVKFFNLPNNNLIALDHKKRIYLINLQNATARPYPELEKFSINQLKEDLIENNIWLIGGLKGGLYKINKNSPEAAVLVEQFSDKIITHTEQIENTLWIITLKQGLYKINNNQIEHIEGLNDKQITQFLNINNTLFIATLKDGLYYFRDNQLFSVSALQGESLSSIIFNDKYIYIPLDFSGGLFVLNINNLQEGFTIKNLHRQRILEIIDFENNIWVRTATGEVYKINDKMALKVLDNIATLKKTGQKLFFLDNNEGAYILQNDFPEKVLGLENYKINAIYFKENLYWVETYKHDIFTIQPDVPNQALAQPELQGINIWSIAKYNNKYVIGSNKGAFAMTDNYKAYPIASAKDQSTISIIQVCNQLWIGTLNGYLILDNF